jgi:hypothetical protein
MPTNTHNFSPYSADQQEIARQQALAQALQQEGSQGAPAGQMAGQVFVPTSPLLHLAKALKGVSGGMHERQAAERAKALQSEQEQRRGADMSLLAQALGGRPASPGGLMEDASGNVTQADPMAGQTPVQSLGQALPMLRDPNMQQAGFSALLGAQTREDTQKFNASQAEENRKARIQERIMQLDAASQNASLARDERAARAKESADLRRELQSSQQQFMANQNRLAAADRQVLAQQKNTPKLPTPALKLQQEELEAIGTAASINADIAGLSKQIEDGKLNLSLPGNVIGSVRNTVGLSNENSRNLASFKATLEKLRNDSLRLNKGVQTEGDAQRAWNEMIANINDPGVVKQRLGEIQQINERAVNLRKMNVDSIRSNFGLEAMDTGSYTNQPAAVGAPAPYAGPERRNTADPLGLRKK